MTLEQVKPSLERLPEYQAALERGWSPRALSAHQRSNAHGPEDHADGCADT
jgi:hypothetical protein